MGNTDELRRVAREHATIYREPRLGRGTDVLAGMMLGASVAAVVMSVAWIHLQENARVAGLHERSGALQALAECAFGNLPKQPAPAVLPAR